MVHIGWESPGLHGIAVHNRFETDAFDPADWKCSFGPRKDRACETGLYPFQSIFEDMKTTLGLSGLDSALVA